MLNILGFLVERRITLYNNSLISVDFTLNAQAVDSDVACEDCKFDSSDGQRLLPLSSTEITVRLKPTKLGQLKVHLILDALGYDFSCILPIEAE